MKEAEYIDYRGTNEGSELAGNAALWRNRAIVKKRFFNKSGFSALPAGCRGNRYSPDFGYLMCSAYFWSSQEEQSYNAWARQLSCNSTQVERRTYDKTFGFSVRLVKDLLL